MNYLFVHGSLLQGSWLSTADPDPHQDDTVDEMPRMVGGCLNIGFVTTFHRPPYFVRLSTGLADMESS